MKKLSTRLQISVFFTLISLIILVLFSGFTFYFFHQSWKNEIFEDHQKKTESEKVIDEEQKIYEQQESELLSLFLFIGIFSSFFLFFIGYLFAWKILEPLRIISEQTKKISLKNLSHRLPLSGKKPMKSMCFPKT